MGTRCWMLFGLLASVGCHLDASPHGLSLRQHSTAPVAVPAPVVAGSHADATPDAAASSADASTPNAAQSAQAAALDAGAPADSGVLHAATPSTVVPTLPPLAPSAPTTTTTSTMPPSQAQAGMQSAGAGGMSSAGAASRPAAGVTGSVGAAGSNTVASGDPTTGDPDNSHHGHGGSGDDGHGQGSDGDNAHGSGDSSSGSASSSGSQPNSGQAEQGSSTGQTGSAGSSAGSGGADHPVLQAVLDLLVGGVVITAGTLGAAVSLLSSVAEIPVDAAVSVLSALLNDNACTGSQCQQVCQVLKDKCKPCSSDKTCRHKLQQACGGN
jgi:hypothetical protein